MFESDVDEDLLSHLRQRTNNVKMKITATRFLGTDRDRFNCTVDGKSLIVFIRDGSSIDSVGDLDDSDSQGDIHIAVIDKPRKAAKQIAEPFASAKANDVVILLCPGRESRKATLAVLNLSDSATVFDRQ